MKTSSRTGWLAAASLLLLGCASQPRTDISGVNVGSPEAMSRVAIAPLNGALPIPSDLNDALRQAQAQRAAGDLAAAIRTLSQLVLVAPDDPRIVGEYGKTLTAQGRSEDALAFLERAIALKPDWSLYSAQGVAYDQAGNYAAAQAAYDHALGLKPGEPSVLSNDALSHMQSGDLEGAERLLMQAMQYGQPSEKILSNLALLRSLKASGQLPARMPAAQPAPPTAALSLPEPGVGIPQPAATEESLPALSVPEQTSALPPNLQVPTFKLPSPPDLNAPKAAVAAIRPDLPAPAPARASALPALERLKSDPSVRMQPVPKDPYAGRIVAKVAKPAAKTAASAGALSGAAALRPALSDWTWTLPAGASH